MNPVDKEAPDEQMMLLSLEAPAVRVNHFFISSDGTMVRLAMAEASGDVIIPRNAVCMGIDEARIVRNLLSGAIEKVDKYQSAKTTFAVVNNKPF